ncbi:MAG: glucosamine-6-phosphate synthase, partial [Actinomycetota bacterium]|nr:glucosamine-6-phosphate synthase [Actinomycetota bacterium]
MCGIVAVLRRPARRQPPSRDLLIADLEGAASAVGDVGRLGDAAAALARVDEALRGVPGVRALLNADLAAAVQARAEGIDAQIRRIEVSLDTGQQDLSTAALEQVNAALVRLKDAVWGILHDRLRTARAVRELAGERALAASEAAVEGYTSIQLALSAIDRLEVRGRDSAGLHVLVEGHGLDLSSPAVSGLLVDRLRDRLFTSMAVRTPGGHLAFVYKAAAEIGELGDNTRRLREAIRSDELLRQALSGPGARATVLGHTRWASVGLITEANAHPLNQEEEGRPRGPYVVGALNGDVDNHPTLKVRESLCVPAEVTTDAKVIPVLLS